MASKYSIFQIQGGLGKHIAATAVAKAIKAAHPDRKLIVVCAWPQLWATLPFVHRVYPLGQTQYFYSEYIDGQDSLIFAQEPYFTTTHIHKQLPLIESWCKMYGIPYNGEQPELKINPEERKAIRNFYTPMANGKPILLLHTNGGLFNNEKPYSWARDMPYEVACAVADRYRDSHFIMQICRPAARKIPDVFVRNEALNQAELVGILELTDKRLLIDSSLQHAAAAFNLPSTVLWNATSPVIFGHTLHHNITAKEKPAKALPGPYLFDYQFDGNESEFPYEEEDLTELFNLDEIVASLG